MNHRESTQARVEQRVRQKEHSTCLERVRGEQRSDLGYNGAAHAAQHNGVALMQEAIDQHHVNGGAQALNDLHLQDCTLRL